MTVVREVQATDPLSEGFEAALRPGQGGVRILIPESFCFHIHRPAPPGGWTRRLREELRPGLFPVPCESLWWDEEVHPDGAWEIWALEPSRLLSRMPSLAEAHGLHLRICTSSQAAEEPSLSAFPNMAPPHLRPRRWPWAKLKRSAIFGLPPCIAAAGLAFLWFSQARALRRVESEWMTAHQRVNRAQMDLLHEQSLLRAVDPSAGAGPTPFVLNLDALTRLLPEDSRAVDLRWEKDHILLDVITAKPEIVRDALEASPEFKDVHFEGNLERRADRSRLTLSMRVEAPR